MIGPEHVVTIRPESPEDGPIIQKLTKAAFADMPFSDGDEHMLVGRLREAGDLALSLVAEDEQRIVGHIAFSPVEISDGAQGWMGLGPVSVWPELHGKGIGGALIRRGIADLKATGTKGIVLLGSPEYYARFGFRYEPDVTYPGPPAEYFQTLLLSGEMPAGEVRYAPAFG